MATANKQNELFMNWITDKIKTTYIKIDDKFENCDFAIAGWVK